MKSEKNANKAPVAANRGDVRMSEQTPYPYARCPLCLTQIAADYEKLLESNQMNCPECQCLVMIDLDEEKKKAKALADKLVALGYANPWEED